MNAPIFKSIPEQLADIESAPGHLKEGVSLDISEIVSHVSDKRVIFGKISGDSLTYTDNESSSDVQINESGYWVLICNADKGVLVEKIKHGFNDKPRKPLKP